MANQAVVSIQPDPNAWRLLANCRGLDTNLFFAMPGDTDGVERAKAFCNACRVRRECLEYAHQCEGAGDPNLDLGIYGGLTYDERRRYWRSRRPSNLRKAQDG